MRNYFLSVSTGTKRRKRDSGRESECGGLWELMDGLAGAWRDQGCCPLPQAHPSGLGELGWGSRLRACPAWVGGRSRDHCAQPPGTSSHPVGTGSPPKCQLGCSSPPTGNASVDHWLSLPGRPREGWSGAARTPGTPRTPRACRLRVGAGCKDLHGWAHALPGPQGWLWSSGPPILSHGTTPRDTGPHSAGSAGLLVWRSGLPELPLTALGSCSLSACHLLLL